MTSVLRLCTIVIGFLFFSHPALASDNLEGYAYCQRAYKYSHIFSFDGSFRDNDQSIAELETRISDRRLAEYGKPYIFGPRDLDEFIERAWRQDEGGGYCEVFSDLRSAEQHREREIRETERLEQRSRYPKVIEEFEYRPLKASDQKGPLHAARVPWVAPNGPQFGYEAASISISYQFLTCADEITLAYAIDPKSVEVSDEYRLLTSRNEIEQTLSVIADVPEPPAVRLDGHIKGKDPVAHARWPLPAAGIPFQDQFAGSALGFGCFTGQTQRVGMIKDLAGSDAGPEQIKSLIDDLRLVVRAGDGPLRNATLESRAMGRSARPEAEAPGLAQAEAERLAREQAEAEDLAERWAEHERQSRETFERAEAERKALQEAQERYEREMAAKRAADEKYARDMAAHEAELQRLAAERAEYERKMAEYRELVANRR